MTDPKKRLEEILYKKFGMDYLKDIHTGESIDMTCEIIETAQSIDKEFVHKNNLPNEIEIEDFLEKNWNHLFSPEENFVGRLIFTHAIRKLIEGKK